MCRERTSIQRIIESPFSREVVLQQLEEVFLDDLERDTEPRRDTRGDRVQSRFFKLSPKTHTASFKSRDPGGSGKFHQQDLRFPDFTEIGRENLPLEERLALAIQAGNVLVFCSCEDFLFKGYKYMGHIGDYGTRKETRPPEVNNPALEGSVCKHLNSVFQDIETFIDDITRAWQDARDNDFNVVVRPISRD